MVEVAGGDQGTGGVGKLAGHVGHALVSGGVEEVVFLHRQSLTAQLAPRGYGPHAGAHAPVLSQDPLSLDDPRHPHAGGQQLDLGTVACRGVGDLVQTLENALDVDVLGLGRLDDRLVVHRQVVHDVAVTTAVRAVPALQRVTHDVADLVGVGRVVGGEGLVGPSHERGVAVHVLGTLTGQRRATGRGTDDEATGQLVPGGPELVGRALEAEHRVEDVDRDHRLAVGGVAGTGHLEQ
ncbi:MAG: Arginase/agmatinase/formimionoglutamate hydrolase, arginase family [Actinomyces urogenitalis DORA_12]|uniref:Arginase/agmatinase/formimionoglutamate hydrolase, arginase family n=1 Tax=Actinomyces urogenitalis DORA_12 TaxID=1403939 RepID=W1VIS3_9ACTO|nr:MAG: Arginase/agmatinase/formimionoglutamate hydrolase, arginase family [Actinomyces urogenitalis DORA_12]